MIVSNMSINLTTETKMEKYIKKNNYLVIYPDASMKLYTSLRKIEEDILVHSSSISKKLKEEDYCICVSKGTNYVFYIKKLT